MTVSFDYGLYSGKYQGDPYTHEKITVDGREATLSTGKTVVGLYVGEVRKGIKLSIGVSCKEDQNDVKRRRLLTFGSSNESATRAFHDWMWTNMWKRGFRDAASVAESQTCELLSTVDYEIR